jgi:hypothetical protein
VGERDSFIQSDEGRRSDTISHIRALMESYRTFNDPEAEAAIGLTPEVRRQVVESCESALSEYELRPDISAAELEDVYEGLSDESRRLLGGA